MTGPPSPVDRVVGTGQPLGHGRLAANTWYAVEGEKKGAAVGTSAVADVNSVKLTNTLRKKAGPVEIVQVAEVKEEGGNKPLAPSTAVAALPHLVALSLWYYQQYSQSPALVYEHPMAGYV